LQPAERGAIAKACGGHSTARTLSSRPRPRRRQRLPRKASFAWSEPSKGGEALRRRSRHDPSRGLRGQISHGVVVAELEHDAQQGTVGQSLGAVANPVDRIRLEGEPLGCRDGLDPVALPVRRVRCSRAPAGSAVALPSGWWSHLPGCEASDGLLSDCGPEHSIHGFSCAVVAVGPEMRVRVQRLSGRCMPQPSLNGLDRLPMPDQQGGEVVPEIVESGTGRQRLRLDCGPPGVRRERRATDRAAVRPMGNSSKNR